MEKFVSKSLNIPRLLALGYLNVRKMASQNESLTASQYFSDVEKFVEDAPSFKEIFCRLSVEKDNAQLENIQKTLSKIGCTMFDADIDCLKGLINKKDEAQIEKKSSEIWEKLDTVYGRIKSTCSQRKIKARNTGSSIEGQNDKALLKDALKYFDYEEEHRKLRILAVDDVSAVLNTITSVLNPYYEVFALKDASQVEVFLSTITPELFLLDIEMPGMNGYDLIPVIRKFEEHKNTPIIFLTGNASVKNLKNAIAAGACDFMTKPVSREILLEKIGNKIIKKKLF